MAPFGFMDDGLGDETFIEGGDRWTAVRNDEYGTTGGGWELWGY